MLGVLLLTSSCDDGPQTRTERTKPGRAAEIEREISGVAHNFRLGQGTLDFYVEFPSQYLAARSISVWLPDGYSDTREYAVLYMHDGQMLFDASATWNRQEWGVDETAQELIDSGKIRPFIVVGLWSRPEARYQEYFPQKAYEALPEAFVDSLKVIELEQNRFHRPFTADRYLEFIVKEVRPFIEKNYSVARGPEHTFIAGSSMGGLISMYAQCEYPEVFGGAACLSTHWPGLYRNENNPIPQAFLEYLDDRLPSSDAPNKWYFDYGNKTLDSLYPPHQRRIDSLFRAKGISERNWTSKYFPGADHSEDSWKARLPLPLMFLLGQ